MFCIFPTQFLVVFSAGGRRSRVRAWDTDTGNYAHYGDCHDECVIGVFDRVWPVSWGSSSVCTLFRWASTIWLVARVKPVVNTKVHHTNGFTLFLWVLALAGSAHRLPVSRDRWRCTRRLPGGRGSPKPPLPEFDLRPRLFSRRCRSGAEGEGAAASAIQSILSSGAQQVSTEIPRCTP